MSMRVLIPRWSLFILLSSSFSLMIILSIQFLLGLVNGIRYLRRKSLTAQRSIYNLYLFHHLFISILRSLSIAMICLFLLLENQCLSLEYFIHFLLLLSTFDLFLLIIGEVAHFWDSTINHSSTLYSKCFLLVGILSIYFVSTLFLSIHITMEGDNPLIFVLCENFQEKSLASPTELERASIPTIILYILFCLLNLLTFLWIYVSYKDIEKLKRKRLATVFFTSLVFTKFKDAERKAMVNLSLKRLSAIYLFVLSNIIAILPILTIKVFKISCSPTMYLVFTYITALPWCESLTCLCFPEMRYHPFEKPFFSLENQLLRQQIGSRLSSYSETRLELRRDETY